MINMIRYIEQTMKTFKNFGEQLKNRTRHQSDPKGHAINLSKKTFTKTIFQLLNKNLNFILTPKVYYKSKLNQELEYFYRLLKLKAYFKHKENKLTIEELMLIPQKREKWTPNKYYQANQRELEKKNKNKNKTKMKEKPYNNLTKNERTNTKELSEPEDILIAKLDRGGSAVIVTVKDYIKEAE